VRWITEAGGRAPSIAHPGRYAFSPTAEYALFTEFIAHGGRGVEVVTGAHSQAEQQKYAAMALELDMLASRGSDFHAPTRATPSSAPCPTCPGASRRCGWRCANARSAPERAHASP
jgi:predicted metal-dependent phosphoesterase TrpH